MDKKKRISIVVLIIGIITLICGIAFLVVKLLGNSSVQEGKFLVEVGKWQLIESTVGCENTGYCPSEEGVFWDFIEIGKGKLTTNDHINDYDFIWAIEDDKLKIETNWLYLLDDEYDYSIDEGDKILTLTDTNGSYRFRASEN